jgi:[citrate (pro-3S)-lyase] ligase
MFYTTSEIRASDKKGQAAFDTLLQEAGIKRDKNLDYVAGLYAQLYGDDDNFTGGAFGANGGQKLVAAGACFANTLRCLAVDCSMQGEGLMAQLVTHLVNYQLAKGNVHLFLYTKPENDFIFSALGFYEVARLESVANVVANSGVLLMENRKNGFSEFLENIKTQSDAANSTQKNLATKTAALVMNCNPFTLGHRYLIEEAAQENDTVHLFVVSEDLSFFPFAARYRLIQEGCSDLPNVILHETGSYMISSAVFPSYFLKDEALAIEAQARLDIAIFTRIASALGITVRYVGEEPFSEVTGIYNKIMRERLLEAGIQTRVFRRKEEAGSPISASSVRKLLQEGRIEETKLLVPETTYRYFLSAEGQRIIETLKQAKNVVHY